MPDDTGINFSMLLAGDITMGPAWLFILISTGELMAIFIADGFAGWLLFSACGAVVNVGTLVISGVNAEAAHVAYCSVGVMLLGIGARLISKPRSEPWIIFMKGNDLEQAMALSVRFMLIFTACLLMAGVISAFVVGTR